MLVVSPPVMGTAKMPGFLAIAVPSVGWESALTLDTTKVLPGMPGARFKKAWPVGASTNWAMNDERLKKVNGILNINGIGALEGPGVMVEGVPGDRRSEDIVNIKMFMPYVEIPGHSEDSRH